VTEKEEGETVQNRVQNTDDMFASDLFSCIHVGYFVVCFTYSAIPIQQYCWEHASTLRLIDSLNSSLNQSLNQSVRSSRSVSLQSNFNESLISNINESLQSNNYWECAAKSQSEYQVLPMKQDIYFKYFGRRVLWQMVAVAMKVNINFFITSLDLK